MSSDLSTQITRVDEILQSRNYNLLDCSYDLYSIISSPNLDEEIKLIQYICNSCTPSPKDSVFLDDGSLCEFIHYTHADFSIIMSKYGGLIAGLLQNMVLRGYENSMDEYVFYHELWSTIRNHISDDSKTRAFALFLILSDIRIPYFKLEKGLKITDEEFKLLRDSVDSEIFNLLRYIILCNAFEQKTEFASILLREIENTELNHDQRVFVMSLIIQLLEKNSDTE